MLRKFIVFFLAFFVLGFALQMILNKGDQEVTAILIKTFISGLVAAGVFVLITKNR